MNQFLTKKTCRQKSYVAVPEVLTAQFRIFHKEFFTNIIFKCFQIPFPHQKKGVQKPLMSDNTELLYGASFASLLQVIFCMVFVDFVGNALHLVWCLFNSEWNYMAFSLISYGVFKFRMAIKILYDVLNCI